MWPEYSVSASRLLDAVMRQSRTCWTSVRASSSVVAGKDSSPVPTRHWRVNALYCTRHVRSVSTTVLSNHHPRLRVIVRRSEEHTSELQSLMRISYAVFCLKKKKYKPTRHPLS